MKKGINKSILFYIASVDSSFLCLGSTHKKKENNTDDK